MLTISNFIINLSLMLGYLSRFLPTRSTWCLHVFISSSLQRTLYTFTLYTIHITGQVCLKLIYETTVSPRDQQYFVCLRQLLDFRKIGGLYSPVPCFRHGALNWRFIWVHLFLVRDLFKKRPVKTAKIRWKNLFILPYFYANLHIIWSTPCVIHF